MNTAFTRLLKKGNVLSIVGFTTSNSGKDKISVNLGHGAFGGADIYVAVE